MSTLEEWRPVVGFENAYEVSSLGRVRSLNRWTEYKNRWGGVSRRHYAGQLIASTRHSGGYLQVSLYSDGVHRMRLLHAVVAAAFIGPRPDGAEVLHGDGVKDNCRRDNLRYGTRLENEADKELHKTRQRGEVSASAKLNAAAVLSIRVRIGEPQQDLANEFGCTFSNISAIQLRKSWKHV
jgi:hypothetical protein